MSIQDQIGARTSRQAPQGERRNVHIVGSLPPECAETEEAGFRWLLDHVGGDRLTTLPCDRDPRWIIRWLEQRRHHGVFQVLRDGDSADYTRMPAYRLRRGMRLSTDDVVPRRADQVTAALAARTRLGAGALPPYQVSMPAPLDLTLFAFGVPAGMMGLLSPTDRLRAVASAAKHLRTFTMAVVQEVERIREVGGADVVVQLESPAILVAHDRTPRALWPAITNLLTRQLVGVLRALPRDTRLVLHTWCRGDLGHRPIAALHDLAPFVTFTNTLATRLRRLDLPIPPIHVALCDGQHAPSTNPTHYLPLRRLHDDIPLYAGLVDEGHPDRSAYALGLVEVALGRPVDAVAAACGLGRRTAREAEDNAALATRLATLPSPAVP